MILWESLGMRVDLGPASYLEVSLCSARWMISCDGGYDANTNVSGALGGSCIGGLTRCEPGNPSYSPHWALEGRLNNRSRMNGDIHVRI